MSTPELIHLEDGEGAYLRTHLFKGMVVAFHAAQHNLAPCPRGPSTDNPKGYPIETDIHLLNKIGDVVLKISIRRAQNAVLFNAQAKESLLDGWGRPESIPLNIVNPSPPTSGLTISVCDRGDKYQILFNLSTVHYFAKRFPGPATLVFYDDKSCGKPTPTLWNTLTVHFRTIGLLPGHQKGPIESGQAPPLNSLVGSVGTYNGLARGIASPNDPFATLSWDNGKEIRVYHLGLGNILWEHAYSGSRGLNGWYHGDIHDLNIALAPTSSVAVIRWGDQIHIYYQDPKSNVIKELRKPSSTDSWTTGAKLPKAAKDSNISAISWSGGGPSIRVYYQDPDLRLKEHCYSEQRSSWYAGAFNPGIQPRGTPIISDVSEDPALQVNVLWKNARNQFSTSSWGPGRNSSWSTPSAELDKRAFLDGSG